MSQAGEIVPIPFPYTDLATSKRRPVLALRSADRFGDFLAAAITSQAGHEETMTLCQSDFQEGALPKASYVRSTKLYTLNQRIVVHRFGMLTPEAFARSHRAVCSALGC